MYRLIIFFCLFSALIGFSQVDQNLTKPPTETKEATFDNWPIVNDKATGIELEFPGEFKPIKATEGIAFGGQDESGDAKIVVIASPGQKIESPEELWSRSAGLLGFGEVKLLDSEEISQDDLEIFQIEKGVRQSISAVSDEKMVEGVYQYFVFRGRSVMIIAWADASQWEQLKPTMLFSLDTLYIW